MGGEEKPHSNKYKEITNYGCMMPAVYKWMLMYQSVCKWLHLSLIF